MRLDVVQQVYYNNNLIIRQLAEYHVSLMQYNIPLTEVTVAVLFTSLFDL